MTLKRKITMSNIIMICVPVVLAVVLWSVYVITHNGMYLNPRQNSADGDDSMLNMQYTLYLYENELADLDFEAEFTSKYDEPDILLSPQIRRIQELSEMGFHMQMMTGSDILFTDLDENDLELLRKHPARGTDFAESIDYFDNCSVIRDRITQNGKDYLVTAVYDSSRVNISMQDSLLPVYLISPQIMIVFILIVLTSVVITNIFLTRWLNRSILKPLNTLTEGAKEISNGNLDASIEYGRQDEFGVVCREFDSMREKLKNSKAERERYERNRRNLISGISHDLRSPLTSIKGYTEGLKDGIADTEAKKERYYHAILTRTADMERLLENMSTLVRLDNSEYRYHFETVSIDEFLRQLIKDEEAYSEQNRIQIAYHIPSNHLEAKIDIREMRRVFVNLLENSVKYRVNDVSKIGIDVTENLNGKLIEIRFSDDGPGVDEEQLELIFDSFYRADESRTKPENGSGLGLAVVKSIVEGHGGSVKAYNDSGLVILIRIPRSEGSGTV